MKKFVYIIFFVFALPLTSCNANSNEKDVVTNLSPDEVDMLTYMREEEKLARDVYKFLYDTHGHFTFENIMQSEQTHMDRILMLLNQYGIDDPATGDYGKFSNSELQDLYNTLTAQGKVSLVEALKVGATIEDLDIKDLMEYSEKTQNPAILQVFDNLTCGSRNHLRAFVNNLNINNGTYAVQFISNDEYNSIINGSHERCGMNQQGMRQGKGRGQKGQGMRSGSGRGMRQGMGQNLNQSSTNMRQSKNRQNCIYQTTINNK